MYIVYSSGDRNPSWRLNIQDIVEPEWLLNLVVEPEWRDEMEWQSGAGDKRRAGKQGKQSQEAKRRSQQLQVGFAATLKVSLWQVSSWNLLITGSF